MPNSNDIIKLMSDTGLLNIIEHIEMYNNVVLAYDQDKDVRLKMVVDRIKTPYLTEDLMAAYECDGALTLIWKDKVPELFKKGEAVAATYPDDHFPHDYIDYWHIENSLSAIQIKQKAILKKLYNEVTLKYN